MRGIDRFGGDDGAADDFEGIICDACYVNAPHEHKCHSRGSDVIGVDGEALVASCECPLCWPAPGEEGR